MVKGIRKLIKARAITSMALVVTLVMSGLMLMSINSVNSLNVAAASAVAFWALR